eukprot:TRINITY_DN19579_c0_g1_i5.p1 TRINITY_DN19579_c0_g1~~TRINITY_DN19579_c0_g1_i5.p1  ORF type:complete len:242 (+),score=32.60 TRINITY_DN19579_c0_g1_i5:53-727(+)
MAVQLPPTAAYAKQTHLGQIPKVLKARYFHEPLPKRLSTLTSRFRAFLGQLGRLQVFERSRPSEADGVLRISLPFCGHMCEATMLVQHLHGLLNVRPDIKGVEVFCSDITISDQCQRNLQIAKSQCDRRVRILCAQVDLSTALLPVGDLVLGFHPEGFAAFTNEKCFMWQRILSNCITAAPIVVFTCFSDADAQDIFKFACSQVADVQNVQAVPVEPRRFAFFK